MAPVRQKKRASDQTTPPRQGPGRIDAISTPTHRSPIKHRKMGVTSNQKQALLDNLQLEITERARRLRAQYNLQAQGLRSRIEIRINRIPTSLRKVKMEQLLLKYAEKDQRSAPSAIARPPPVPAKDAPFRSPQKLTRGLLPPQRTARAGKRMSDQISGDKENEIENMEQPKKRTRGHVPDAAPVRPAQILSPTSSNSRMYHGRPASPAKSQIARPGSPLKSTATARSAAPSNMLSNLVERAKSSRAAGARKVTTVSNASSSSSTTAPMGTRRAAAAPAASKAPASRPATRLGRRVSANSETSEASTNTVVRKTATTKAAPAKKKAIGTFTKGTASGDAKKASVAKTAAPATTRTGRVLRNRAA